MKTRLVSTHIGPLPARVLLERSWTVLPGGVLAKTTRKPSRVCKAKRYNRAKEKSRE